MKFITNLLVDVKSSLSYFLYQLSAWESPVEIGQVVQEISRIKPRDSQIFKILIVSSCWVMYVISYAVNVYYKYRP